MEQHAIGGTNYVVFLALDEGSIIKHWEGTDHFMMVSSKCEYFSLKQNVRFSCQPRMITALDYIHLIDLHSKRLFVLWCGLRCK